MEQSPDTEPIALLVADHIQVALGGRFHLGPLDVKLSAGNHTALLGPSGSGKSTLLRLLTGHLVPTDGQLTAFGKKKDLAGQLLSGFAGIRYVWQDAALPPFQRVRDSLRRELAFSTQERQEERILALAKRFHIAAYLDVKAEELSLGQRQRCAIAIAFSSRPSILALDEPFSHQDSWLRQQMLEAVRLEAKETGTTLLLCTHALDEAIYLTNSTLYLLDGQSIYHGPIENLQKISIPEVQALFGWVSAWAESWEVLDVCSEKFQNAKELKVATYWHLPTSFLFKGHFNDGTDAWVSSQHKAMPGDVIWVHPARKSLIQTD